MWLTRTMTALGLAVLAAFALASGSVAETYPSRTVTLVVPYPAGGLSDVVARAVARDLQERLGQPVIVENRVGGSGTIGAASVAHAAPDGYTLLVNAIADVTNLHYMPVPYDILTDFTPIAMMVEGPPLVLVAQSPPPTNRCRISWPAPRPTRQADLRQLRPGVLARHGDRARPGDGTGGCGRGAVSRQLACGRRRDGGRD